MSPNLPFHLVLAAAIAALLCGLSVAGSTGPSTRPTAPTTGPARADRPAAVERVPTDVVVKDVDGTDRKPFDAGAGKAAVVFFLSHDCPISNGYAPEINRICAAYGDKGVTFTVVHPFPELTAAEAKAHAAEYGFAVPVVVDAAKVLTAAAKPRVTPEAAVVAADGRLLYCGRIDDNWAGYGKRRVEPTSRDLRDAIDAALAGRPVRAARTDAVGCPI